MVFFTSDQHFDHYSKLGGVIAYCNRPFSCINEMNENIISNFNSVVKEKDTVFHLGDFCMCKKPEIVYKKFISRLNGNHIFLQGSHDYWLNNTKARHIYEKNFDGNYIVLCHYALRVWPRSHWNSILLYGHSHGKLDGQGKSMDCGVDTCYGEHKKFYPYSLEEIVEIMKNRPDNFNLVNKDK